MTPTMPFLGQAEAQVVVEHAVAEPLDQVLDLDHGVAQARARRDLDLLEVELAVPVGLGRHLLVPIEARPGLGLAGAGARPDPFELVVETLAHLLVLGPLDLEAGGLRLEVGGVVALVGEGAAAVELEDPLGDVVQEVPVVGDRDDGTRVLLQVLLEPEDGLGVQVVGGLVEQQQVGLLEQELAQGDPASLATGEAGDVRVGRRAAERVHRLLELAVEVPGVLVVDLLLELAHLLHELVGVVGRQLLGDLVVLVEQLLGLGDALLDVAEDRLVLVELRLLGEDAHGEAGHQLGLAVGDLLDPGHDLQQRRLAGAVRAHDADLRPGEKAQRDVVENDLVTVRLTDGAQAVNVLGHVSKPTYWRR